MDDKTSPLATSSIAPSAAAAPLDQHEIRRIVIGVLVAMLLGALDQTIIATALPTIGRALSDLETLSWVVTSYLVAATAVTPIYGKLSDTYGRRKTMLAGILIFLAGSVACALAPSMTALIVARFVQGLGGGGLLSLAQTVIGDVVPPRERGRYQGYIGAVFATASVAGPVLGGVTAEYLHWSLIFWINLPIGLIAWLMTRNGLRRLPHHHRPHDIDYAGAALMVLATVALLLALTFGGTRFAWASGPILGLFAMSIGLWFLFALRLRAAVEPFLPLSLLANKIVRMGAGSGALAMGTMTGLSIFSPLYFETVYRLSSSRSGLAMIPMLFAITVSSTYAGRLMSRMMHYKRIAVIGLLSASAALAVLALHPANLSFSTVLILFAIIGAGIGPAFPVTTVAIQNAVPMHQLGTATGLLNFARQLSSALIVAVFGAIALGGMGLAPRPLLTIGPNENAPATFQLIFAAAILGLLIALTFLLLMEERRLRGPDDPI